MIIRGLLVISIFTQLASTLNIRSRERHDLTISECAARGGECDETKGRQVCGTDDQTYPSRCHLLRVQCSGYQVSLKYRGPCKACKEAREYALKHRTKSPAKFIPKCKSDGTYASVQCLVDSGCWCSDVTGKPIENTSVRTGKPKCREYNKTNIRRSPARQMSNNRRRSCTQIDRANFNQNLIKVFQSEYIRYYQQQRNFSTTSAQSDRRNSFNTLSDNVVLDWKFATLDTNFNNMLDKIEFRELKKLVKRVVKPKRCGRAFGKYCDVDNDESLTRNEWNNCITKSGINGHSASDHNYNAARNANVTTTTNHQYINQHNNENNQQTLYSIQHQTHHVNNNQNTIHRKPNSNSNNDDNNSHTSNNNNSNRHYNSNNNKNNNNNNYINENVNIAGLENENNSEYDESSQRIDYDEEPDYDNADTDDDDNNTFGLITNYSIIHSLRPKPDLPLKESEGESNCLVDRANALEEQQSLSNSLLYIPECTPDGRYQRVQCYRPTPYCWCVNEDTGKNIPGTSVKNKRPQCDSVAYPVQRPMKGCPEPRKTVFLKDLKEFLKLQIPSNTNASANTTKWSSEDERIATLSFILLDKNKNKSWERKEWKTFRLLMTNSKTLRKCGKKMPRYCDVNSDKKITLSEWLNCFQVHKADIEATSEKSTQAGDSTSSKPSRFTGSNPLEQYLKD